MIPFTFVADDRRFVAQLEKVRPDLMHRLEGAMGILIEKVAVAQKAAAPRGKSGRLASSVGHTSVEASTSFVRAMSTVVGGSSNDYAKAGALEWGAPGRRGRFRVDEHKRRGRGIGMEVLVDRYMRTQRLVELRYLRGPFTEMHGEIEAGIRAAVEDSVRKLTAA